MVLVRDENAFLYTDVTANNSDVVWSIANDTKLRSFAVTGSPYYFFASEDGATVAHSTDYLTFHCYDTKSGNSVGDITLAANGRESGLILTKNNAYVSDHSSSALIIRITNIASGASTLRLLSDSSGYVRSITASRDESTLAAASYTGVRIWKLK
jgi:hypothetical protein